MKTKISNKVQLYFNKVLTEEIEGDWVEGVVGRKHGGVSCIYTSQHYKALTKKKNIHSELWNRKTFIISKDQFYLRTDYLKLIVPSKVYLAAFLQGFCKVCSACRQPVLDNSLRILPQNQISPRKTNFQLRTLDCSKLQEQREKDFQILFLLHISICKSNILLKVAIAWCQRARQKLYKS